MADDPARDDALIPIPVSREWEELPAPESLLPLPTPRLVRPLRKNHSITLPLLVILTVALFFVVAGYGMYLGMTQPRSRGVRKPVTREDVILPEINVPDTRPTVPAGTRKPGEPAPSSTGKILDSLADLDRSNFEILPLPPPKYPASPPLPTVRFRKSLPREPVWFFKPEGQAVSERPDPIRDSE